MTIDKSVFIPVDPDAAFALITRPERLRRWQAVAARVDLRVGGEYRWTITPGHSAAGNKVLGPEAEAGHTEGWNHYFERLVTLATTDDAGADDWAAAPDPLTELVSAEATLAIVQRVLRTLTHGDADKPTPCEDFTVRELVEHLVGSITGIAKSLGVAVVDQPEAAPEVRIADAAQPTLEAFQARGLEGTVDMGFAELPASMVANILNLEFLVHAWDFATATGQDLDVSPVLSDYVLGLAHNTISPQMRGKSFADETLVEESAASMDRLVAFTGRQVLAN
ncbi:TIGR03086 family protein [Pseudarthrobacter sp. NIBRBAC000502772]|uniref:TIGR03086 family metal-binding protein n=1 Tax=Pseudarthrobacter sp. NIBRBAC000502772 TaxID=2590775 RepID=UPI001131C10E|nr:TIGR03086 family metal-binding protein [Pseudarthrobacter sp. NIBRBAC000502772]QDG66024.1 TIGR03086 family protein [Pseudarthrobacter sp. NIBRBAC000502772]